MRNPADDDDTAEAGAEPLREPRTHNVVNNHFHEPVSMRTGMFGNASWRDDGRRPPAGRPARTPARGGPGVGGARVFLCHSSADKAAVRALYGRLVSDGLTPWLDEEDLLPGEDWEPAIRAAVRAADFVVVCLSHSAITEAGFVHKEIRFALDVADEQPEGTIFVIPARLEACELPARLAHLHRVDLFDERGYERLTQAIKPAQSASMSAEQPPRS